MGSNSGSARGAASKNSEVKVRSQFQMTDTIVSKNSENSDPKPPETDNPADVINNNNNNCE